MVRTLDQTKRTTILKAARTILLRDGYTSAKMSDIAAEAGVAPGTLYLYFDSKESLAAALGEDCLNRLGSQFAQAVKKLDTPAGIDALLSWALRIGVQERDILAMVKQSKPGGKAPQAREQFVQQLSESLEDLMARGLIREYDDPADLANVVLAVMHRMIMSCAIFEDSNPERVKAAAVTVLQHALFDDAALKRWRTGSTKRGAE
jgi:AcrR family transcriptional regulator